MEIYSYLLCYLFISLVAIVSGQNQVCPKDLMFNEKISKCEECAKCYEDYKNKVDDLQNKARSIVDTIIDRYGSVDETAHNLYNNLLSAKTIKKDFTSNINEALNKINQLEKYKNTLKDPKINDLVQFLVNSNSTMILRNYLEELFNKTSHFSLNAPNPFDILSLPINTEVELKYLQIKNPEKCHLVTDPKSLLIEIANLPKCEIDFSKLLSENILYVRTAVLEEYRFRLELNSMKEIVRLDREIKNLILFLNRVEEKYKELEKIKNREIEIIDKYKEKIKTMNDLMSILEKLKNLDISFNIDFLTNQIDKIKSSINSALAICEL